MATVAAPPLRWQPSLLAVGDPTPDARFSTLRRVQLDETSWVDHAPAWLSGADELFTGLAGRLRWSSREMPMYGQLVVQPRLSAWWAVSDEEVREPLVAGLGVMIGRRYGVSMATVGVNLYRSGADSVAWHGDRHARGATDPDVVVAVLSLGAPRRFLLRPRLGGAGTGFTLAGGDLLVMGGACQRRWQHCVPKQAHAGPRISVTFRHP